MLPLPSAEMAPEKWRGTAAAQMASAGDGKSKQGVVTSSAVDPQHWMRMRHQGSGMHWTCYLHRYFNHIHMFISTFGMGERVRD